MKQKHIPSVIILAIFLSLSYWIYLGCSTSMNISNDSIEYEHLGKLLTHEGFESYLTKGPNREPVYPMLIAAAMNIEHISGIAYTKIMAVFGIFILLLSQLLTYRLLKILQVRTAICAVVLAYLGVSPALNNTAFSLYSEIAALPFILGIIITVDLVRESVKQKHLLPILFYGSLLGVLFATLTLIKAVFECIFPLYILFFLAVSLVSYKKNILTGFLPCVGGILAAVIFFYGPILTYKSLNQHYNGNFVITNRGPWALYGNTARRMQPLTSKRFLTALAYVPGEGICNNLFGPQECYFWSFRKSDELGCEKVMELNRRQLPLVEMNNTLLKLSKEEALKNPAQYILLTAMEGLKMFFWESTQIGFVNYPLWLTKIYHSSSLKNALRLGISLLTLISFFYSLMCSVRDKDFLLGSIVTLIFLYILFLSFFYILTRYALPVAPLYLITIGYSLNALLSNSRK